MSEITPVTIAGTSEQISISPRKKYASRLLGIDGLRALSISLVIVNHVLNGRAGHGHQVSPLWYMVGNGSDGVFIFFVISGFLITTLLLREMEKSGSLHLGRFYCRRAFRIIPPLYMYILFLVATSGATGAGISRWDVFTASTFTRNILPTSANWALEHFWSLCIEEQFYLLWPAMMLWALKTSDRSRAARVALTLALIAPVFRILVFATVRSHDLRMYMFSLLPAKMDGLMFGCWGALSVGQPRFEGLYRVVDRRAWLILVWFLLISNYLSVRFASYYSFTIGTTLDGLCVLFSTIWVIRNPGGIVGRFLNSAAIVHFGVISYSLYIWETYFLHPSNTFFAERVGVSLFAILIASEFSYYGIERLSRMARDRIEARLNRSKSAKRAVQLAGSG